ncbi:MAG: tetratricopeptide repeat protein [Pedobacter sp.]|nr:MAG: tetratricopeptide repeat protein [Pedobacter sp.]
MFPRFFLILYATTFFPLLLYPRQQKLPDLLNKWNNNGLKADTTTINLLNSIAGNYALKVSDSTFFYAEKALNLSNKLKYHKGLSTAYVTVAKIHYKLGNYDLSIKAAHSSLKNATKDNDIATIADIHNILGLIYMAQGDIDPSLAEFKRAIIVNTEIKNYSRLSMNYFNIGLSYFEKRMLDSAVTYLVNAKNLSMRAKDNNMLAMSDNRLGEIYLQMGRTKKAVSYFNTVIKNKKYQNDWENTFAYTGLAKCFYNTKNYNLAVTNGQTGLRIAKKIKAKWDIEQASKVIHEAYAALGDHRQAYDFLKLEKQYSDSLLSETKDKEISTINLRQKESENQVLLKQNQLVSQENKIRGLILIAACLGCIFLGTMVVLGVRNTNKNKRLAQELHGINATKDQLFSIISHDLRAPLASILSALNLVKSGDLDLDEQEYLFNKLFEQVSATSSMLDNLLLWANSQQSGNFVKLSKVDLPNTVDDVSSIFLNAALDKKITISHIRIDNAAIHADQDQVKIILRNIIANAIKFTPENGTIKISYNQYASSIIVIIQDNGVGMSTSKLGNLFTKAGKDISTRGTKDEKGIGIGLLLVKRFIAQNKAKLQISSTEGIGTTFVLEFPLFNSKSVS